MNQVNFLSGVSLSAHALKKGSNFKNRSRYLAMLSLAIPLCLGSCKKEADQPLSGAESSFKHTATVSSNNLWYDKFVAYESASGGNYYQSTNAATLGWSESYMLRSYMTMYEVTKNTAWLDKMVTHADAIIGNATDAGGDGYLDWTTANYSQTTASYPYLVLDALITYPIAKFVRLIHQDATLQAQYSTKATAYRTFIENEIVPKWVSSSSYVGNCWVQVNTTMGYFKEPTTFNSLPAAVFNPLPYNMMAPYAMMLWTMYDVNGNTSYRDKANQMAAYFEDGLTGNSLGYEWWYCNISNPHLEDTSHGNLDIEMAVEAFNRGVIFSGTHMQGFSNTLTDHMWNQSLTAPVVAKNIDGSGDNTHTKRLTGWIWLTQFNAKAWTIAAEQFRNSTIGDFNYAHVMAQIVAWDPVKVHNQGMELRSYSDATLPARWIRIGTPTTGARLNTAEKFSGKSSAAITSTASDGVWQGLYQDWNGYAPNSQYTVTFNVKTVGTAGARIFMQNTTTGTTVGTVHDYDSAAWTTQTFTFTTPASGNLRLYLENHDLNTAGTAYFDNVVIKRTGDSF